jgi:hypothetical protein
MFETEYSCGSCVNRCVRQADWPVTRELLVWSYADEMAKVVWDDDDDVRLLIEIHRDYLELWKKDHD